MFCLDIAEVDRVCWYLCICLNFSYVDIEGVDFSCTHELFTIEHVNAYSKTLSIFTMLAGKMYKMQSSIGHVLIFTMLAYEFLLVNIGLFQIKYSKYLGFEQLWSTSKSNIGIFARDFLSVYIPRSLIHNLITPT